MANSGRELLVPQRFYDLDLPGPTGGKQRSCEARGEPGGWTDQANPKALAG